MICPFCHNEIADGSLVCPYCDESVAAKAQRERCDAINKSWRPVLTGVMRKPLFLVGLIVIAILNVAIFLNVAGNVRAPFSMVLSCIPLVFAVLTLISMIQVYSSKNPLERDNMKFLPMYILWGYIGSVITTVFAALVSLCLLIVGFASSAILSNLDQIIDQITEMAGEEFSPQAEEIVKYLSEFKDIGAVAILIACVIIAAITLFIVINYMLTFAKAHKFYKQVIASVDANVGQTPIKAPVKRMYIFGVLIVLGSFSSIAVSRTAFLSSAALGVYLFVTGLLFDSIARAYNVQVAAYKQALDVLTQTENATNAFRAQKRMERAEEQKRQAEAERDAIYENVQPTQKTVVTEETPSTNDTASDNTQN